MLFLFYCITNDTVMDSVAGNLISSYAAYWMHPGWLLQKMIWVFRGLLLMKIRGLFSTISLIVLSVTYLKN